MPPRRSPERNVGVIYVTHRLNEVFRISNRVTVLRDGVNVGTPTAETDMKTLVAAIGPKHATAETKAILEEKAPHERQPLTSSGEASSAPAGVVNDRLRGVDLSLMDREIHGLAGLIAAAHRF